MECVAQKSGVITRFQSAEKIGSVVAVVAVVAVCLALADDVEALPVRAGCGARRSRGERRASRARARFMLLPSACVRPGVRGPRLRAQRSGARSPRTSRPWSPPSARAAPRSPLALSVLRRDGRRSGPACLSHRRGGSPARRAWPSAPWRSGPGRRRLSRAARGPGHHGLPRRTTARRAQASRASHGEPPLSRPGRPGRPGLEGALRASNGRTEAQPPRDSRDSRDSRASRARDSENAFHGGALRSPNRRSRCLYAPLCHVIPTPALRAMRFPFPP